MKHHIIKENDKKIFKKPSKKILEEFIVYHFENFKEFTIISPFYEKKWKMLRYG